MSARDLLLNQSALRGTLEGMNKDVRMLDRRVRWPGATQAVLAPDIDIGTEVYDPSGILLPDGPSDWPEALSWHTVASLELDPGMWLLIGQVVLQPVGLAGFQRVSLCRLDGDDDAISMEAYPFSDSVLLNANFQVQKVVTIDISRSVLLEASDISSQALFSVDCEALQPTLIAYPL